MKNETFYWDGLSAFTQQDGRKKLMCDKRDRAITFEFCCDLQFTYITINLFWSFTKCLFKEK